jgi:hypothetical protein
VSDAHRAVAVTRLRGALLSEEISFDEFSERLELVFGATTIDQLDDAFRWLPPDEVAVRRRRVPIVLLAALAAGVVVAAVAVALRSGPEPDRSAPREQADAAVSYRSHGEPDIPDVMVFRYDGDGGVASGPDAEVVAEYLAAIVGRDFDAARHQLCQPLRAEFRSAGSLEDRLFEEFGSGIPDAFEIIDGRSASGNVRYAVSGRNWSRGPLEVRAVAEQGAWRVCGSGLEGSRLGFLAGGARG